MQVEPPLSLVLLPGMDGTGEMFASFIAALKHAYSISVISYPLDGALGYEDLTEFAWAALPKTSPYFLLGESFSGPIAIALAARAPVNLQGLILCATFSANPQPALTFSQKWMKLLPVKSAPPFVANQLLMGRFSTPALRAALALSLAQVSAAALRARMVAVLGVDVTAQLELIRVPVLYLRAKYDALVPHSATKHVLAHCPQAQEVEFEAPHFVLQTQSQAAALCVQKFCAQFGINRD